MKKLQIVLLICAFLALLSTNLASFYGFIVNGGSLHALIIQTFGAIMFGLALGYCLGWFSCDNENKTTKL